MCDLVNLWWKTLLYCFLNGLVAKIELMVKTETFISLRRKPNGV